jgi:hypothetical protein
MVVAGLPVLSLVLRPWVTVSSAELLAETRATSTASR